MSFHVYNYFIFEYIYLIMLRTSFLYIGNLYSFNVFILTRMLTGNTSEQKRENNNYVDKDQEGLS